MPSPDFALRFPNILKLCLGESYVLVEPGLYALEGLKKVAYFSLAPSQNPHPSELGSRILGGFSLLYALGFPLTRLNLAGCLRLIDVTLDHVMGMPLAILNLEGCSQLGDRALSPLRGLPLTSLDLAGCIQLTDFGLQFLNNLPLTSLDLSGCDQFSDAGLGHLRTLNLSYLSLRGCGVVPIHRPSGLSNAGLELFVNLPLAFLDLNVYENLTNVGLENLRGWPLTDLDLGFCPHLLSNHLERLRGLPLQRLVLAGLENEVGQDEADEGINADIQFLKEMPLRCLDLSSTCLTDSGLEDLVGILGNSLTSLNLSDCLLICVEGLTALQGLPLMRLNVFNSAIRRGRIGTILVIPIIWLSILQEFQSLWALCYLQMLSSLQMPIFWPDAIFTGVGSQCCHYGLIQSVPTSGTVQL